MVKVLITLEGGAIQEMPATDELDITVYDKDLEEIGEEAFGADFEGCWHLSKERFDEEIERLKKFSADYQAGRVDRGGKPITASSERRVSRERSGRR